MATASDTPLCVTHLTAAERAARGKAARGRAPLASHGEWSAPSDRPDPVALLEEQAATRVPELVPIRYGRMLTSPFAFYRGGAYLMASDLAGEPRTGLAAQLCGDAHLSNFGGFASAERSLIFSVNDFDETLPGPFEWDVKRLLASFAVVGRQLGHDATKRRRVVLAGAARYRSAMAAFAAMTALEVWYARLDVDRLLSEYGGPSKGKDAKTLQKTIEKAHTKDSTKALAKLTRVVDGEPRIIGDPPLIVPIRDILGEDALEPSGEVRRIVRTYRRSLPRDRRRLLERYRVVDLARKVVGVGSVGTRTWIVLLLGNDDKDALFLQLKEAQRSVLEPFLTKSEFANSGQRVVEGQRLMQSSSDIMLGWDRVPGLDRVPRDFYVRQLWDWKSSADVDAMDERQLTSYGEMCAWTLARAHARSGDPIAISAYLGKSTKFDNALVAFAEAYADQNERDYAALESAVADGRIVVQTGI
jgi:uncharacterized protein (DUF2252 family)